MRWVYGGGIAIILVTFLADISRTVDYNLAANWSLTGGAMFVTAFTIIYGVRSNWRANHIGVILFTKSVFLTAMLWQIVASAWSESDYPFRQEIRFVLYTMMAFAYITMTISVIREQRRDRRELAEGDR